MSPRSNSNLVVIDLKDLLCDLDGCRDPSEVIASCQCGERIGQEMNRCPVCNRFIVWLNSKVWDYTYRVGTLGDHAARFLMGKVGIIPKSKIVQWYKLRSIIGDDVLLRIANDVVKRSKKNHDPRRSIIPRIINIAKQEVHKKTAVSQETSGEIPDLNL